MSRASLVRTLAIVAVALVGAAVGAFVSIRVNGPAPWLATAPGRWLAEHAVPGPVAPVASARDGDIVGPLALTDLDGRPQTFVAPSGRRVLVNLWASWCGPCRDEMPLLEDFATARASDVDVVGIAQDDRAAAGAYLRQTPVNYRILVDDPAGHAGIRLGNRAGALPYTALIGSDGRLLRRHLGPFPDAKALAEWVDGPESKL